MAPRSFLLWPTHDLSSCLFAGILRDTRGAVLADDERYNHFPASPLFALSLLIDGELQMVPDAAPVTGISLAPPMDHPKTSWSPGPMAAISVGLYPEAWRAIEQAGMAGTVGHLLRDAFTGFAPTESPDARWQQFCRSLSDLWSQLRSGPSSEWAGSRQLGDWSRALLAHAALAGPGRSVRALERRIKRWSGQTRQSLEFYAAFENLHRLSVESADTPLAILAAEAGFADQSHMGRAVKRGTGFTPAQLNRLIETEEPFWCYRLLGERY